MCDHSDARSPITVYEVLIGIYEDTTTVRVVHTEPEAKELVQFLKGLGNDLSNPRYQEVVVEPFTMYPVHATDVTMFKVEYYSYDGSFQANPWVAAWEWNEALDGALNSTVRDDWETWVLAADEDEAVALAKPRFNYLKGRRT